MTPETDCGVCLGGWDGDSAEVYNEYILKARKPAKCGECRKTIEPGEQYEKVKMLYEGDWLTYRTCAECREIRNVFSCGKGWLFESLWEDMRENVLPILTTANQCFQKLSPASKLKVLDEWKKQKGLK